MFVTAAVLLFGCVDVWHFDGALITHTKKNTYHTGIGSDGSGAVVFVVAHRFTPNQLKTFGVTGTQLIRISFMPAESQATYSVRVWIGGAESGGIFNPGTLVYSGAVISGSNLKLKNWNDVTLTTPITIPSNQELWIGYHINTQGGYPAATDDGPHFDKFGNLILWNGNWQTLDNTNKTLSYNWMIRGFTECNCSVY